MIFWMSQHFPVFQSTNLVRLNDSDRLSFVRTRLHTYRARVDSAGRELSEAPGAELHRLAFILETRRNSLNLCLLLSNGKIFAKLGLLYFVVTFFLRFDLRTLINFQFWFDKLILKSSRRQQNRRNMFHLPKNAGSAWNCYGSLGENGTRPWWKETLREIDEGIKINTFMALCFVEVCPCVHLVFPWQVKKGSQTDVTEQPSLTCRCSACWMGFAPKHVWLEDHQFVSFCFTNGELWWYLIYELYVNDSGKKPSSFQSGGMFFPEEIHQGGHLPLLDSQHLSLFRTLSEATSQETRDGNQL